MDKSSNNQRIAKNTAFLYLRMLLVLFVSLFTTRVVLNSLGVVDYGINNVVGGFVSMFAFLNTSMSNGIQRFYNYTLGKQKDGKITDVYNTAVQIQLLLAIVLFILLETVGLWYMYNKMVIPEERFVAAMWVFQMSVCSMMFVVLQIPYSAAIIAYERMDYFAYVSIFEVFAKLVIAYSLYIATTDRLILYGCLQLIVAFFTFLFYFAYCKKSFVDIKIKLGFQKTSFFEMLSFSGWNVFGTFAYMVKGQGINILLNLFFGPAVNAARGVSFMINNAIQGFQNNITLAFRPQIVQSYASGNMPRVNYLFFSLSKISFVLLTTLSLPIIVDIDYILHLWLGNEVPEYTKQFTILILVNMIVSSLNTPMAQIVHATGKMRRFQITTSIIVCSILPVAWCFLKMGYDAYFVYWVSLIITVINQIVCSIILKSIYQYSIKEYLASVITPLLLFSIVVPILPYGIKLCMDSSFGRLILIGVMGILSCLTIGFFLVLNKQEKSFVVELVRKNLLKK